MADDIGKAFAHEEWLKDRVEEELKNTESEFGTIIDANQMRSTDAAATVVAALAIVIAIAIAIGTIAVRVTAVRTTGSSTLIFFLA